MTDLALWFVHASLLLLNVLAFLMVLAVIVGLVIGLWLLLRLLWRRDDD